MAEIDKKDIDIYEYIKSEYYYEFNKISKIDAKVGIALTLYGLVIAYNSLAHNYTNLLSKNMSIFTAVMLAICFFIIGSSMVLIFNLVKVLKFTGYQRVSPYFFEKKIKNENEKELYENIIDCIKENQSITDARLRSLNRSLTLLPILFMLSVLLSFLFEIIEL